MTGTRPLASVSLDVDNLWSYMKTHGDPGWERRPSYLPHFIPLALEALDELGLTITFFVVGADAARDDDARALSLLTGGGRAHEVGNHSFEHEPWLHRYQPDALARDIEQAERAIIAVTGSRPTGFRGPGYSWSVELLEVLAARGYIYDASTLPTYLGPLARAYYFRTAKLNKDTREERAQLFGTFADGRRPIRPYRWMLPSGRTLLEIPVTTLPVVRTPFHLSYLLYLSRISEKLMIGYLRAALAACRVAGVGPSFLLHPLDLLGGDQVPALRFFPGMDLTGARKRALFHRALSVLGEWFSLVPLGVHARALVSGPNLEDRRAYAGVPAAAMPPAGAR